MGVGMHNCQRWLRDALREHRITCLLRQLTSHPDFLAEFYAAEAFLMDSKFVSVMLICLTAVEHNSSFLLADINPVLYPLIYQAASATPAEQNGADAGRDESGTLRLDRLCTYNGLPITICS